MEKNCQSYFGLWVATASNLIKHHQNAFDKFKQTHFFADEKLADFLLPQVVWVVTRIWNFFSSLAEGYFSIFTQKEPVKNLEIRMSNDITFPKERKNLHKKRQNQFSLEELFAAYDSIFTNSIFFTCIYFLLSIYSVTCA